jgi:hypothetical protein
LAKDTSEQVVRRLEASIHQAAAQTELIKHENEGLRASLATKIKRKGRVKRLPFEGAEKPGGGAIFWSPRVVGEARSRRVEMEAGKLEEKLRIARVKKNRTANKVLKEKQKQKQRVEREKAKEVREKEKAEKAAKRERLQQERTAAKALQLSQKSKHKASRAPSTNNKRQKRSGGGAAAAAPVEEPSAPSLRKTLRGGKVHLPKKFR